MDNGLRAILVSNLKPGEEAPNDSLSDSDLESNNSESLEDEDFDIEENPISDQEAKARLTYFSVVVFGNVMKLGFTEKV